MRSCARCTGMLDFAGVAIDPPRAVGSRFTRSNRRRARAIRATVASRMSELRFRYAFHLNQDIPWGPLALSIIPGIGHIRLGFRAFGWIALSLWTLFIIASAAFCASPGGWLFYLAAVGWHCFVITALLSHALLNQPLLRRAGAGLLIYAVLHFALYYPATLLMAQIAVPVQLNAIRRMDALKPGDVILCSSAWTSPTTYQRGDIVYYFSGARGTAYSVAEGAGIDRIIGLPGDTVAISKGHITVNGAELSPSEMPLGPVATLPDLTLTVTEGSYVILPSTFETYRGGIVPEDQARQVYGGVAVVSERMVLGRAVMRIRPWSRIGRLQ